VTAQIGDVQHRTAIFLNPFLFRDHYYTGLRHRKALGIILKAVTNRKIRRNLDVLVDNSPTDLRISPDLW